MQQPLSRQTGIIEETLNGIVERVTFHNPENGWAILRVRPFNNPHQIETVIVHQTKVFAGATMEFKGKCDCRLIDFIWVQVDKQQITVSFNRV